MIDGSCLPKHEPPGTVEDLDEAAAAASGALEPPTWPNRLSCSIRTKMLLFLETTLPRRLPSVHQPCIIII